MKIVSWNINGIASCRRKGFLSFIANAKPDIMCCQETKTSSRFRLSTPGYHQYWNHSERSGYAGTLILTRSEPLSCAYGLGVDELDHEGRLITLEFKNFYIVNAYVPSIHTYSTQERHDYRMEWETAFREYLSRLQRNKPIILCGDFNATRAYIDSYPENGKNEPDTVLFTSETRDGFEKLLALGVVDVFRIFYPCKEGAYTWWGPKNNDRTENRGSRLDYILVSGELLSFVQSIKFHKDILGSDHCPISMLISPVSPKHELDDTDMAAIWSAIDWQRLEETLLSMQQDLAYAAYNREWDKVDMLQRQLVNSWAARALAVRTAADAKTAAGVDGVKWLTNEQKGRAVLSLTPRGYRPLPYLHRELEENGKVRTNLIPTIRDKTMQILYSYALDPVAESTADRRSFFARKGRSALDAHAYLSQDLSGEDAPQLVVLIDVQTFYDTVAHDWMLVNIPMDKTILRKFLKAGMVRNGELFPSEKGMSMASSLSPIMGNMMLDGLQSCIYDGLYPNGKVDYLNGALTRFADDIIVTVRSRKQAEIVMQTVADFLAQRGLRMHPDKSAIVNVYDGFDYLGRHYQRRAGVLSITPADSSIRKIEHDLKNLIMNFDGTQRDLIEKINQKIAGWGNYHRTEDAYMEFRHIDAIVEGLLIDKMCAKYPRWHRQTVLEKFWVSDGFTRVFALPNDHSVRVNRLAPLPIAQHKPCKLKFNPYLDQDYHVYLKHRRDMQKSNGRYRGVWTRQSGRCAYCGERMLPDQEVELVEKNLGQGWKVRNLIYIHRQCAYQVYFDGGETMAEHIDLFSMLEGLMDAAPADESPYVELTDFFRRSKQQTISLRFSEIENILGDILPWEAYCFDAFWYQAEPDQISPMWQDEGFPFQTFQLSDTGYCIAHSWINQGYKIKALHRESGRVVFRRSEKNTSGYTLPKALTDQRLPDEIIYKFEKIVQQFIKDYGL